MRPLICRGTRYLKSTSLESEQLFKLALPKEVFTSCSKASKSLGSEKSAEQRSAKIPPFCSHGPISQCIFFSCNAVKMSEIVTAADDVEVVLEALDLKCFDPDVFSEVLRIMQRKYLKVQHKRDESKRQAPIVQRFLWKGSSEEGKGRTFYRDPLRVNEGVKKALKLFLWLGKQKGFAYNQLICQEMAVTLAKSNKLRLLWKFLHLMASKDPKLVNTKILTSIIDVLGEEGLFKEALNCFYRMKQFHCKPDLVAYNTMINVLCRVGHFKMAKFLFEKLKIPGFPFRPDAYTYAILISGFCKHSKYTTSKKAISKRLYEASRLFREMQFYGYGPDVVVYNCLIDAFCKRRRIDRALDLFHQMPEDGCSPNHVSYNSFIRYYSNSKQLDRAIEMLNEMRKNNVTPKCSSYTPLIHALCKGGRLEEACQFLIQMVEDDIIPMPYTYRFIKYCLRRSQNVRLPTEICMKVESRFNAR